MELSDPWSKPKAASLSDLYNKGDAFLSQGALGAGEESKSLNNEVDTDLLLVFEFEEEEGVGRGLEAPDLLREVRLPVTALSRGPLRGVEGLNDADAGVDRLKEDLR